MKFKFHIPIKFRWFQVFRQATHDFFADDGLNVAASLAFFAILGVIPMLLISISIIGQLLGQSEQLFEQVSFLVRSTLPQVQPEFLLFLKGLVDKSIMRGGLGVLFLFFVASLLFANLEHLLDRIFKCSRKRNFWHSRIISVALIFVAAFILFVPGWLHYLLSLFPAAQDLNITLGFFLGHFTYALIQFLVFLLLIGFIPHRARPWRDYFWGACLFAGFTLLGRVLFRSYMDWSLGRYHLIYGSMTLLMILIIWIYYWSVIFVFCAELVNARRKLFLQEARGE